MTTAYEAYAIVRGDSDPAPRAGLVELGFQPERRWTPEGIAAGVTFLSVAAYHDSHSTHIRVQGTDRDKVLATAQGLVDAVARREPIPTDDLPGVAPAGEQPDPEAWRRKQVAFTDDDPGELSPAGEQPGSEHRHG